MGFEGILGDKKLRRISTATGLNVVRGWAWSHYQWEFVTADHVHYDTDPAVTRWKIIDNPMHFTSCRERWPDDAAKRDLEHQSAIIPQVHVKEW